MEKSTPKIKELFGLLHNIQYYYNIVEMESKLQIIKRQLNHVEFILHINT